MKESVAFGKHYSSQKRNCSSLPTRTLDRDAFLSFYFSIIHINSFNALPLPKENVCTGLTLKILYMPLTGRSDMNKKLERADGIESIVKKWKSFSVCLQLICAFRSCKIISFVCANERPRPLKYFLKSFFLIRR